MENTIEHTRIASDEDRLLGVADNLLYTAWTILANAYEGDWDKATPEWRDAVIRFREDWHEYLASIPTV